MTESPPFDPNAEKLFNEVVRSLPPPAYDMDLLKKLKAEPWYEETFQLVRGDKGAGQGDVAGDLGGDVAALSGVARRTLLDKKIRELGNIRGWVDPTIA